MFSTDQTKLNMATLPRTPTSQAAPTSPGGTLKRGDNAKKGWMGTLTRKNKAKQEVSELESEGRNAIESPTSPISITPDTFVLEENEERSMVEPASLEDQKVKELKEVLMDWINDVLADLRILVRDLTEDLYDGQILAILMEKLANIKLEEFQEVTQTVQTQKAKLSVLLDRINKLLDVPTYRAKWNTDNIHSKDVVAILHLLVALARHFNCPTKLPKGVTVNMVIVQKKGGLLLPTKTVEELTDENEGEEDLPERDAFDALFDTAPEKLVIVRKSLQSFVNRHLNRLDVEVSNLDTQFHDGVYFIFLLGLLEGFFVPLYQFYMTPNGPEQKREDFNSIYHLLQQLHNMELAFDLMRDSGIKFRVKPEDVVNRDLKSTLRILYSLFQKYKHLK